MRRAGIEPFMLIDDDLDFGGVAFTVIVRFFWRYRSELVPIWLALTCEIAAIWLHIQHPRSSAYVLAVSVGTAIAIAIAGKWLGLRLGIERAYATLVTLSIGGWVSAAVSGGPGRQPLPMVLLIGGALLSIPWWAHRRRRARVRVERTLAAWPEISSAIDMVGSRIQSAVVDPWGYRARIRLARGQTVDQAIAKIPAIESALGTRRGAARILPVAAKANRLDLRVVEIDPHANSIIWPGPSISTINDPMELGLFEDGSPVLISFLRRHALVGGVSGSGKSGGINAIIGNLSACADVVLWGIDLKKGMELMPWASCFDRIATTAREAECVLADAMRILDRKAETLAARGERVSEPTPDNPALVVIIDEYAELAEESQAAVAASDSIARRGRAAATQLIVATQRPSQSAMGRSSVRSQMDVRLSFRVREKRDGDLILGQGMHKAGWHADQLDEPGKFFVSAPEHHFPRRARAYLLSDQLVQRTAMKHAPGRPALSVPAPKPGAAAEGSQSDRSLVPASTARRGGKGAHRRTQGSLEACLAAAPSDGASVGDLLKATGMSRTTLHRHLKDLENAGQACQVARARWRAAQPSDYAG